MRDWPNSVVPNYPTVVFLDRDGTITVDTHYPHRIEALEFIPGSLKALKELAKLPVHIIVVSNQAGIALGLFTRDEMSQYNRHLRAMVEEAGGRIDAFYYCPDKEPRDLTQGELLSECAKPAPGMLLEAARDFRLILSKSWLVGDKLSDIAAGKTANCHTILVRTGKAGAEPSERGLAVADFVVDDLSSAAELIESQRRSSVSSQRELSGLTRTGPDGAKS